MKNSIFIVGALGVILLIALGFYIFKILTRIAKLAKFDTKKKSVKIVMCVCMVIVLLLTVNIFSLTSIAMLHFVVLSLITDVIYISLKRYKFKGERMPQIIETYYGYLFVPIVVTLIFMVCGYYNMMNIGETDYSLKTDKTFSIEEDGSYRIALIADVHFGVSVDANKLDKICEEISDKDIDIVILAGDIVDENTIKEQMEMVFESLGKIKSKYGIFYTYGNHDRQLYRSESARTYTMDELKKTITSNNIIILEDEIYELNEEFTIIGREDASYTKADRAQIKSLVDKVNKDSYCLVVDHQPKEYKENKDSGVDLLLSGHTHGGQIWPANFLFSILKFDDAVYGLEESEDSSFKAIVTSGLAGWGYAVKTAAPAEYVIIDVTSNNAN